VERVVEEHGDGLWDAAGGVMVEVGETVEETKVMEVVRSGGHDAIAVVCGRSVVSGGEEAWGDQDLEAWQRSQAWVGGVSPC
jgi:hypothetical protein